MYVFVYNIFITVIPVKDFDSYGIVRIVEIINQRPLDRF